MLKWRINIPVFGLVLVCAFSFIAGAFIFKWLQADTIADSIVSVTGRGLDQSVSGTDHSVSGFTGGGDKRLSISPPSVHSESAVMEDIDIAAKKMTPVAQSLASVEAEIDGNDIDLGVLLSRLLTGDVEGDEPVFEISEALFEDANARQRILSQYHLIEDASLRAQLAGMLSFHGTPDVFELANKLSVSHDPQMRAEGFSMLSYSQLNIPAARKVLLDSLRVESEVKPLSAAIYALMPESLPTIDTVNEVTRELEYLAHNSDPSIQAATTLSLSRWHKGLKREKLLLNAIASQEWGIVDAGLIALAETPIHNPQVKSSIMSLVANTDLDEELRERGVDLLMGFELSSSERQSLNLTQKNN